MTNVVVRPAVAADIDLLVEMDHSYHTDYVWQMEMQTGEGQIGVSFREVRLPRSMRVEYPRNYLSLPEEWMSKSAILVAENNNDVLGYAALMVGVTPLTAWATDLVVRRRLRRHGIGTALLVAAQTWAKEQGSQQVVLEMQPKNYPAIGLAGKLGYAFCGYSDGYYENQDIALFFSKRV